MSEQKQPEFQGLRAIFFPVTNEEIKKFLPMALMMFCILFNYTVLRDTKDALVVNAPGSGAEALAFLKLYGTTPVAILFMILYAKLASALSRENLFYACIVPFLVFFCAFALFIYPNVDLFHMNLETIQNYQAEYPYAHWIVPVLGNWSFSVFYILSEMWGSVVISLLFWQFANQITRVREAKRFYGLFGMIGNIGLIFSGYAVKYFSDIRSSLPEGVDAWGVTLNYLMTAVVVSGLILIGIYRWMNKVVLTDKRFFDEAEQGGVKKKKKAKLSLGDSFKYLLKSPYLGLIAVLVLAYGVSINVVEGVWKAQLKLNFKGNPNDYNAFMGKFSMITGVSTIILMIIGNNIMRRVKWKTAALITPIMILVTSLIFFAVVVYGQSVGSSEMIWGMTMLFISVIVGLVQNVMSKATKYSLFDPTKEMSYIPLDDELKTKGKAAVDVIGGRAGKSGGAFIQTTLLTVFAGSMLADLAHILAVIVIGIVTLWLLSVLGLSKKFEALTKQRTEEAKEAKGAKA